MRLRHRTVALAWVIATVAAKPDLAAQEPGHIELPPSYDPAHRYPVLALFPPTGGNAGSPFGWYVREAARARGAPVSLGTLLAYAGAPDGAGREHFVVIYAAGAGRQEDYATEDAWFGTITRYEDQLLEDLARLAQLYSIDTTRVVMSGFSMGGDLSWALCLRNPRLCAGAIVMGSRASYGTAATRMTALAARRARFAFGISTGEATVRRDGARAAIARLERLGMESIFLEFPGEHAAMPLPEFARSLEFVFWSDSSPAASARRRPAPGPAAARRWRAVTAGASHACALAADSTAYCWGNNGAEGRLGDGTTASRSHPAPVAGTFRFRSLSTTADHTCGIARDRRGVCWGDNTGGKLGDNTDTSRTRPVRSGPWQYLVMDAGAGHSCAVLEQGYLYCWGTGTVGQLAGAARERTLYARPASRGQRFLSVAAGDEYVCGLTADSLPYCWGAGFYGGSRQASNPVRVAGSRPLAAITTGSGFACGLTAAGVAYCWGYNRYGSLGTGRTANSYELLPVAGDRRWIAVDAGLDHTCGVTTDHAAYCWGHNDQGQLGDGSNRDAIAPTPVWGGLRFASISAGRGFTCGVTLAGAIWCWGANASGQLGDGSVEDRRNPVPLVNPQQRAGARR